MGEKIIVQGGTFYNDSVLRGFEKLLGKRSYKTRYIRTNGSIWSSINC